MGKASTALRRQWVSGSRRQPHLATRRGAWKVRALYRPRV